MDVRRGAGAAPEFGSGIQMASRLTWVVEFSGMSPHCDFAEQVHTTTEDGAIKPDIVVHVPGGGQIVVDSKLPLDSYLNALESEVDSERDMLLGRHAKDVRNHVNALSKKAYWEQFDNA